MDTAQFQIRQCLRDSCRFRFPVRAQNDGDVRCPRCGAITQMVEPVYQFSALPLEPYARGVEIEVILDNIRSTYNVGAMFRTADGAGLRHLHLCGMTPTPQNPKIAKTALGAERSVPWSHAPDACALAAEMKANGVQLWALESSPSAMSIFDAFLQLSGTAPLALVVGNEVTGVDPGILEKCDQVIAIPMQGVKRSLNVAIAFGIAAYPLRYGRAVHLG